MITAEEIIRYKKNINLMQSFTFTKRQDSVLTTCKGLVP